MSTCAFAQVNVNGDRKFLGSVDTSTATMTQPFRLVETTPTGPCLLGWVETIDTGKLFRCRLGVWEEFTSGGGSGAVSSVFGRTGPVTAQAGDYSAFYPSLSGSYENPSWINSLVWSKLTGIPPSFTPSAHTQPASTITDFASASRALFSAGSGLSYNEATGEYSCTGCSGGPVSVEWSDVLNKPVSFPPSAHTQSASTITDFLEASRLAYTGEGCIDIDPDTGVITYTCTSSVDWDSVENKPTEFTPAPHTHQPSDVFELDLGLKLTDDELGIDETVVPLFYSGSAAPTTGEAYRFYFRSNGTIYYFVAQDTPIQLVNLSQLAAHATRALLSIDIPNNAANTSGNAATATALAATPTTCPSGQAPRGVLANGNATDCQSVSGGTDMFSSTPGATVPGGETGPPVVPAVRYTFFNGGVPSAFSASRNTRENVMVSSGTVSNCYVNTSSAQTGSALVFVLLKNGVATGIEISINGSAGIFSDTTHTATYSAGDLLSWQATNNSTATSAVVVSLNCRGN